MIQPAKSLTYLVLQGIIIFVSGNELTGSFFFLLQIATCQKFSSKTPVFQALPPVVTNYSTIILHKLRHAKCADILTDRRSSECMMTGV